MPRPAMAALGMMLVASVWTVGCSDDDHRPAAARAQATIPTSPPSSLPEVADCPHRTTGSSPAAFDPTSGSYAAQSLTVVGQRQLRFDVVQWLSGKDANEAYFRESGDASGAPNDYYILNQSPELHTAPVTHDATVLVLTADGLASSLHTVPLTSIPTGEPTRTFWLTFDHGSIIEICQQYRP